MLRLRLLLAVAACASAFLPSSPLKVVAPTCLRAETSETGDDNLVVDDAALAHADDQSPDVVAQMLLMPVVRGHLERAGRYLARGADAGEALDLLMGTAGYRRFEWLFPVMAPDEDRDGIPDRIHAGKEGTARRRQRLVRLEHDGELDQVVAMTEGYSASDLAGLIKEAANYGIREVDDRIEEMTAADFRAVTVEDFNKAVRVVRPSVSMQNTQELFDWAEKHGCVS